MDNAELLENVNLCYLTLLKLQEWLKKNSLLNKDFVKIKSQWNQELENNSSSFFIDAELLISKQDIVLLQIEDKSVAEYLAKTYQIKEQQICQKLFGENKHFILLTRKQWELLNSEQNNEEKDLENCIVLFKDEETIKNKLTKWLKNLPQADKQLQNKPTV